MRCSSTSTPATGIDSEPVAMMMFLAPITSAPPSPSTVTSPLAEMRPLPLSQSILFFLNRNSMPAVLSLTTLFLLAIMVGRSSSTEPSLMPWPARLCLASSNFSELVSSALDGMQPTLRQVPPSVLRCSTQAVFRPSCAARMAAT